MHLFIRFVYHFILGDQFLFLSRLVVDVKVACFSDICFENDFYRLLNKCFSYTCSVIFVTVVHCHYSNALKTYIWAVVKTKYILYRIKF